MANAVNVKRVIGRAFRKLIDKDQNLWLEESFWTDASDVEFSDGKTAQDKVGSINGITSDVTREDTDIASSILPVHNIKSNLDQGIINDRIQLVVDNNGNLNWRGADSVLKKLGSGFQELGTWTTLHNYSAGDDNNTGIKSSTYTLTLNNIQTYDDFFAILLQVGGVGWSYANEGGTIFSGVQSFPITIRTDIGISYARGASVNLGFVKNPTAGSQIRGGGYGIIQFAVFGIKY